MDISKLGELVKDPENISLQTEMEPQGQLENLTECDYTELFALNYSKVPGFYEHNENVIRFKHESNNVITKFEGVFNEDSDKFDVEFSSESIFESGINYLGKINITISEETQISVRVFGEGSYDPASPEKYLSKHSYTVLSGFIVTALYSAKKGASINFMKKIFEIIDCHPVCKSHKLMVEYMKSQIESACYNFEEPKGYGCFLKNWAKRHRKLLINKEFEDLLTYIYLLVEFKEEPILPCKPYVDILVEKRKPESEIINCAEKEPNVYIKPTPEFIKDFCRIEGIFFDMRELEKKAKSYNLAYKNAIKKELIKRNEDISDPTIHSLTKSYYQCSIF